MAAAAATAAAWFPAKKSLASVEVFANVLDAGSIKWSLDKTELWPTEQLRFDWFCKWSIDSAFIEWIEEVFMIEDVLHDEKSK